MQQMQQTVQECQVGARLDLQEQARLVRRRIAARIDHDQSGAGLDALHHAQIQDRVAVRHVGADHEEQIGLVEILIRARRTVGAQRELVAAAGARHAQARVRFDIVGTDEALGELVHEVLRLDRHLPRHVERQRVGAMRVEQRAQAAASVGDHLVERQRDRVAIAVAALESVFETSRLAQRDVGRRALGAKPSEVGRMFLVAGDLDDLAVLYLQDHAAANAAVGAHRLDACAAHHVRDLLIPRPRPGRP